jgi:hypothetical protein
MREDLVDAAGLLHGAVRLVRWGESGVARMGLNPVISHDERGQGFFSAVQEGIEIVCVVRCIISIQYSLMKG